MKKFLALLIALVFPFSAGMASADVASDLNSKLSLPELFANATENGKAVSDVVMELIALAPDRAIDFVVAAVAFAPDKQVEVQQAAILAGADPTAVMAATAAGLASSSIAAAYGAAAKVPSGGSGHGGLIPTGTGAPIVAGGSVSPS